MNVKNIMLEREKLYSKYASFDKDSIRLKKIEDDIRPNYFRDIDRIIHSSSYTRYMKKTQVFSLNQNDNISMRMVHVQLVSKIGRTIGRALSLNEDLIEAIALGHDLGHCPFGHVGERILNKLSLKYNEGCFMHNVQSVRILKDLEHNGIGANVSIQVLDGILCHNGEFELKVYCPKKKSINDFLDDYNNCYRKKDYDKYLIPMTLEGCVVRISDIIGYIGRDIEDAIKVGIFKEDQLPDNIKNILGKNNSEIINTIINDIIENSIDKPYIKMSDNIFESLKELKALNYKNIYIKANSNENINKYEEMFNVLFENILLALKNNDKENNVYKLYLNKMSKEYLENNSYARITIDYLSSMTDDFFIREYEKIAK